MINCRASLDHVASAEIVAKVACALQRGAAVRGGEGYAGARIQEEAQAFMKTDATAAILRADAILRPGVNHAVDRARLEVARLRFEKVCTEIAEDCHYFFQ